jgi:ribonuclease-3
MTQDLDSVLQHEFSDKEILSTALMHGSAPAGPNGTYERLEFLGDRVLSLVVAELLFETFPAENEGKLARRYAALVRRETLADVAVDIGLGVHIVMSQSESEAGGRENPSLLADVCEAVIAALYLDGGLTPAAAFIHRHWQDRMRQSDKPPLDSKTALQEWAQGRGLPLPKYSIVERTGPDHAPTFTIAVSVGDTPPAQGEGSTRRTAEQAAAGALMERLEHDV